MKISALLYLLFLYLISSSNVLADQTSTASKQSNHYFGVNFNYSFNQYSADFRALPGVPNCCPKFDNGDGRGGAFGLTYRYKLGDIYLSANLNYFIDKANLEKEEATTIIVDNLPYEGLFNHTIESEFSGISFVPGISYNFLAGAFINLGFASSYTLNATYDQEEVITNPPDRGVFPETGASYRNKNSGDIENPAAFVFSGNIWLSYQLPLTSDYSLSIIPKVGYSYGLTDLVENTTWKKTSIFAGLDFCYNFIDNTNKHNLDDNELEILTDNNNINGESFNLNTEDTLRNNELESMIGINDIGTESFKIKAYAVEDGIETPEIRIVVEEILYSSLKPLLNYVFFDTNSSDFPARYNLLPKEEAKDFEIIDIAKKPTLDIYWDILNIIGRRMIEYPDAVITVDGRNMNYDAEKSNKALSLNRAEKVKDYLVNIWGIAPARIKINQGNLPKEPSNSKTIEGREENRRVEIRSNNWNITAPIIIDDTLRQVSPPLIRFRTEANTEINTLEWKIIVSQDERILGEFKDNGKPVDFIDFAFDYEYNKLKSTSPVVYKLIVVNTETGNVVDYKGEIPLSLITLADKMAEKKIDKRIDRFGLILFSFDKSNLSSANRKIVDIINTRISENSEVTVRAFTDMLGEDEYNMQLSLNRAKTAAKAINTKKPVVEGLGESRLLYDNSLPEGRFYCRTVEIIVVTPITVNK